MQKQGLITRDGYNRTAIACGDEVTSANMQNKFQLTRDTRGEQKGSWMSSKEEEKEG